MYQFYIKNSYTHNFPLDDFKQEEEVAGPYSLIICIYICEYSCDSDLQINLQKLQVQKKLQILFKFINADILKMSKIPQDDFKQEEEVAEHDDNLIVATLLLPSLDPKESLDCRWAP